MGVSSERLEAVGVARIGLIAVGDVGDGIILDKVRSVFTFPATDKTVGRAVMDLA